MPNLPMALKVTQSATLAHQNGRRMKTSLGQAAPGRDLAYWPEFVSTALPFTFELAARVRERLVLLSMFQLRDRPDGR